MSYIIIRFIGLAIHIGKSEFPTLDEKHRVVLLGYDGGTLHGKTIQPHHPVMLLPDGSELINPLHRVKLRVANAKQTGFDKRPSFLERVAHLDASRVTLIPKEDVMCNGAPPVEAYFDADNGQLHACKAASQGAIGTWLKIDTDGDPILEATSLDNSNENQRWTLSDRGVVGIYNSSADGGDDQWDYLINYLAFAETTIMPLLPPEPAPVAPIDNCFDTDLLGKPHRVHQVIGELTSACSNTTYP